MRKYVLVSLIVLAILVSGCVSQPPSPGPNEVIIRNFAFNPPTLTVKAGTMVNWTNEDSEPHTVTSNTGVFDSGTLSRGERFQYTFNQAGTYDYICTIHPYMNGRVIVE